MVVRVPQLIREDVALAHETPASARHLRLLRRPAQGVDERVEGGGRDGKLLELVHQQVAGREEVIVGLRLRPPRGVLGDERLALAELLCLGLGVWIRQHGVGGLWDG